MERKGGAEEISRESATKHNERNSSFIRRRDALKSFVAGFAAVPLVSELAGGQQNEIAASSGSEIRNRRDQLFDNDWRFYRGDTQGAESPSFDDSSWRLLDLPHDWSVDALPPIPESDGAGSTTALVWTRCAPPACGRALAWTSCWICALSSATSRRNCCTSSSDAAFGCAGSAVGFAL